MELFIKFPENDPEEFTAIEFQGVFESQTEIIDGMQLGNIVKKTEKLQVGVHFIEGVLSQLKKPILIVNKENNDLIVKGWFVNKIVFDKRPTPILNKPLVEKKIKSSIFQK